MAVPRSMRALAAITLVLFVFVLLQLFKGPTSLSAPSNKLEQWTKDPQSDRKPVALLCINSCADTFQLQVNPPNRCAESKAITMPPITPIPTASTPPSSPWCVIRSSMIC